MKNLLLLVAAAMLVAHALSAQAQSKKPAPGAAGSASVSKTALVNGGVVYQQYCVACHQAAGNGVANVFPPLVRTDWVLGSKPRLIGVVLKGMQGKPVAGVTYASAMPSQANLTDQQVADVLTYVRNSFGNKASAISASEVKTVRSQR